MKRDRPTLIRWTLVALIAGAIAVFAVSGPAAPETDAAPVAPPGPSLEQILEAETGGGCNSCTQTSDCDGCCPGNKVRCDAGGCLCLDARF